MDIAEFLLARFADDEAQLGAMGEFYLDTLEAGMEDAVRHFADVDRIRRGCAAKRRLVVAACDALRWVGEDGRVAERPGVHIDPDAVGGIEARAEVWGEVLAQLALPYADHPDYRAEGRA